LKQICSAIGAKIEDSVDALCCEETIVSTEKSLVDASKFEVKSEWSEESSEIKQEHESESTFVESTFVYCDEHLENPESSIHVSSCKYCY